MNRSVVETRVREAVRADPGRLDHGRADRVRPDIVQLKTRVRRPEGPVVLRFWIPLTPLAVLLSPVAMLAAPLAHRQARMRGLNPWAAAWALGAVLLSLSGTSVDVETRKARIHLKLF